jgi:transposase
MHLTQFCRAGTRPFNKLKNARRLATRYDKTADSYLGFIHIISIRLWMRQFVNAS